ncbi:MAG TPA: hypothetical protein VGQ31_09895 [Candidatus Limnocylindrales bacterium]|jgi:hypothetical protein|nr:hypothetical protein [Candidatus Limnocylindrales bacterium]
MTPTTRSVDPLARWLEEEDVPDALGAELRAWLAGSPRFRAFADVYRDKIRKKLRTASDPEMRRDVRAELLVARLLLADRRFELAFEAYGSGHGGPDLTVSFRGARSFNLEITRRRGAADPHGIGATLLAKLRQLPPSVPNALLIALDGRTAQAVDVAAVARGIRARADAKDEAFFTGRGFEGTRGFYERYLRLGAVFVWAADAGPGGGATLWINRSARIAMPDRAARAALTCLSAAGVSAAPAR